MRGKRGTAGQRAHALPIRWLRAATPLVAGNAASATLERVLDAAEALVREERFHTATMEELAERAGVSRATLFACAKRASR